MQDDIEDFLIGQSEGAGVDMVDQTLSEHNVPTLTEQKHVEYICKRMFK